MRESQGLQVPKVSRGAFNSAPSFVRAKNKSDEVISNEALSGD